MDTQATEIIEMEVRLEEVWSLNQARLRNRLNSVLSAYEARYDMLPGLEFELSVGLIRPAFAVLPRLTYDWEADIVLYPHPPITAIDILSPTQALYAVIQRIREQYLAGGVQSAWLLMPSVQSILLFLPDQSVANVSAGTLRDPATGIEVELATIFR